jgi:hypothetical protein
MVANAGIGILCKAVEMSLADWRRQTAVNLDGVFLGRSRQPQDCHQLLHSLVGRPSLRDRKFVDSLLERTGFELAVPPRWTALRSEVVEEAFGSARYDERGRPQRPAASACSTPQAIPCVRRPILVDRVAAGRALK